MKELKLRVNIIQQLTPRVKKFEFISVDGSELPAFTAGAHIDFYLENGLVRSYSLANDPKEQSRYVTAILREEAGGGGSKFMHDQLSVNDEVSVAGPANNFELSVSVIIATPFSSSTSRL